MEYEKLLEESDRENLIVKEIDLPGYKGRIYNNRVAIRQNMTRVEKSCILAEELGHHYTTSGNILDQCFDDNRKQEYRARLWAYNKLIGLVGIIDAYKNHCHSLYESAEYLNVTEEFLAEALNYYKGKYGKCVTVDNYIVYFDPCVGVLEIK